MQQSSSRRSSRAARPGCAERCRHTPKVSPAGYAPTPAQCPVDTRLRMWNKIVMIVVVIGAPHLTDCCTGYQLASIVCRAASFVETRTASTCQAVHTPSASTRAWKTASCVFASASCFACGSVNEWSIVIVVISDGEHGIAQFAVCNSRLSASCWDRCHTCRSAACSVPLDTNSGQ